MREAIRAADDPALRTVLAEDTTAVSVWWSPWPAWDFT